MSGSKGLNTTDSVNRIRFSNLSERLQKVNIDVIHRVRSGGGSLDIHQSLVPSTGTLGCHFQDELENCKSLETNPYFKRFYYEIWPLVQSLPELLHHQAKVVGILETRLAAAPVTTVSSFLKLISVLGRDLEDDLYPHFHRLFSALTKKVDAVAYSGGVASGAAACDAIVGASNGTSPNPELTGQLFECMSYLIKYQLLKLVTESSTMRQYLGPLLGHTAAFVRDFSGKTFSILYRKLKGKGFSSQAKALTKAAASNLRNSCISARNVDDDGHNFDVSTVAIVPPEMPLEEAASYAGQKGLIIAPKRIKELLEGIALLYFYSLKGVRGCMHSTAGGRLCLLFEGVLPLSQSVSKEVISLSSSEKKPEKEKEKKNSNKKVVRDEEKRGFSWNDLSKESKDVVAALSEDTPWKVFAAAQVLNISITKLFRHMHPANAAEMWVRILQYSELVTQACNACSVLEGGLKQHPEGADSVHVNYLSAAIECASVHLTELLLFAFTHSSGRGLSDSNVIKTVGDSFINVTLGYIEAALLSTAGAVGTTWRSPRLVERQRLLLCRVWQKFPSSSILLSRISGILAQALPNLWPSPSAPLFAAELLPALPADVTQKYLVRPLLQAVVAMITSSSSSSSSSSAASSKKNSSSSSGPNTEAAAAAAAQWLSVLLEILTRLKDIREDSVGTELQKLRKLAEVRAKEESRKKHSAIVVAPLKGKDALKHRDENSWDDDVDEEEAAVDNGDDDREDEESDSGYDDSSDDDGDDSGNASEGEDCSNSNKKTLTRADRQLYALLSICKDELTGVVSACLSLLKDASELEDEKQTDSVYVMACTCVRWLVIAFPEPLVSDDAKSVGGGGGRSGGIESNKTLFSEILRASMTAVVAPTSEKRGDELPSRSSAIVLAHTTRLLTASLQQTVVGEAGCFEAAFAATASKKLSAKKKGSDKSALNSSATGGEDFLLKAVKFYINRFCENPHSVSNLWALLGLLPLLPNEQTTALERYDDNDDDEDISMGPSILGSILTTSEVRKLLEAIGTALPTPSYWIRLSLLRVLSYLPAPKLKESESKKSSAISKGYSRGYDEDGFGLDGAESSSDDENDKESGTGKGKDREGADTIDLALLCMDAACTPAELRTDREFARKVGRLEVLVRGARLPGIYVRIICGLCLGMLNVKFKPFWEPCSQVLVAAAATTAGEEGLWPLLLGFIQSVGRRADHALASLGLEDESSEGDLPSEADSVAEKWSSPSGAKSGAMARYTAALCSPLCDNGEAALLPPLSRSKVFFYTNTLAVALCNLELSKKERGRREENIRVEPDARADAETVYGVAWDVLKRCPNITLRRSKTVVPMFFRFLRFQYYDGFPEDPELPFLVSTGFFNSVDTDEGIAVAHQQLQDREASEKNGHTGAHTTQVVKKLYPQVLKKRLEMFLKVLAAVVSPRQLFQHQQLYSYYNTILSKPETAVVKLALTCILTYKPPFLMPVRENVKRLLDDKTLRDELVVFDPSLEGKRNTAGNGQSEQPVDGMLGIIEPAHRADLVPLIVRIVFGRFVSKARGSKAAREQSLARRSAILAFLARLPPMEMCHLTHLMIRGIVPQQKMMIAATASAAVAPQYARTDTSTSAAATLTTAAASKKPKKKLIEHQKEEDNDDEEVDVESSQQIVVARTGIQPAHVTLTEQSVSWYATVDRLATELNSVQLSGHVTWERQIGFLHVLEQTVRLVGFGVDDKQLSILLHLALVMLQGSQLSEPTAADTTDSKTAAAVIDGDDDQDDDEEEEENGDDDQEKKTVRTGRDTNQASKVRSMCLLRISEMVHHFHGKFDFRSFADAILAPIKPLVIALPSGVAGSTKPPALLKLLSALVQYDETVDIVVPPSTLGNKSISTSAVAEASRSNIVETLIKCVAVRSTFDVSRVVMDSLSILLERNNGDAILPHAQLIIRCFSKRFVGASYDDSAENLSQLKLSELRISPTGSVKQELQLLSRIAEGVFSRTDVDIAPLSVANLATLLLGMLRTYTTSRKIRVEEEWVIDILRIYRSLQWRVDDVSPHVAFISRLFGPAGHSLSLFNLVSVRTMLMEVYDTLAHHPSVAQADPVLPLSLNAAVMRALTASDPSLIESKDFEKCMPVFQALSGELSSGSATVVSLKRPLSVTAVSNTVAERQITVTGKPLRKTRKLDEDTPEDEGEYEAVEFDVASLSWSKLLGPDGCANSRQSSLCFAVVHECLRGLYDNELVVRAASLAALKHLCVEAGAWGGLLIPSSPSDDERVAGDDSNISWMDVVSSLLIPAIRRGLKQSSDVVKKGFVSLLAHIISTLGSPAVTLVKQLESGIAEAEQAKAQEAAAAAAKVMISKSTATKKDKRKSTAQTSAVPVAVVAVVVDIDRLKALKVSWEQIAELCHGDLAFLLHEDADQNFFENVGHMQLHRRVRALNKLRGVLNALVAANNNTGTATAGEVASSLSAQNTTEEAEELAAAAVADVPDTTFGIKISVSSLNHILLPLGLHPLLSDEFKKKDHLSLLQEASHFVGAIGHHLPWTQYFASMKILLKQLEKGKSDKEKVLLGALCSVLDHFHFDLSGEEEADGLKAPNVEECRRIEGAATTVNEDADDGTAHTADSKSKAQAVKDKSKGKAAVVSGNGGKQPGEGEGEGGEGVDGEDEADSSSFSLIGGSKKRKATDDDEDHQEREIADDDHENNVPGSGGVAGADEEEVEAVEVDQPEKPSSGAGEGSTNKVHGIARQVVNSIMPWVKVFLLKDEKDHKGKRSKIVRPLIAVALTKLISRLRAPVVSEEKKASLFTSLVISVIGTLRSHDTLARDAARDSLAKMINTMGILSLKAVLYELQHFLIEGFQRHVCNYTIRYLLRHVLESYTPPSNAPSLPLLGNGGAVGASSSSNDNGDDDKIPVNSAVIVIPDFDQSIPQIIASVLDDLHGEAQDARDADAATKKDYREAKGNKANDTLEMCARCILFRPTYALRNLANPSAVSSVHALAAPLLATLRNIQNDRSAALAADSSAGGGTGALVGRVAEALHRVSLGLSRNPSVTAPELLLYLHATLQPFVKGVIKDHEDRKRARGMIIKPRKSHQHTVVVPHVETGESEEYTKYGHIQEVAEEAEEEDDDDEEEDDLPSYLRECSSDEDDDSWVGSGRRTHTISLEKNADKKSSRGDEVTGFRARTWLPSDKKAINDQRAAVEERERDRRIRDKVLDGASAPKLTGRSRYTATEFALASAGATASGRNTKASSASSATGADTAAIAAVRFCLTLFSAALRKNRLDSTDPTVRAMAAPFIPLLGQCLRLPGTGATEVVTLALRCLCVLLSWELPTKPAFIRAVCGRALRLMFRGGVLRTTENDLVQSCIKALTSMFSLHNQMLARTAKAKADSDKAVDAAKAAAAAHVLLDDDDEEASPLAADEKKAAAAAVDSIIQPSNSSKVLSVLSAEQLKEMRSRVIMPLNEADIRLLLGLLTSSIMEVSSNFQTASFQLIRAVVDARVIVPEVYDLIEKLSEQIALSQRKGVREASTGVVVSFLISYPLGEKRLAGHMKQMIANCSYAFEEGRRSAFDALATVTRLMPATHLEGFAQMIFLPMTMRLVNDPSAQCRAAASEVITCLSRKLPAETVSTFAEFSMTWLNSYKTVKTEHEKPSSKKPSFAAALVENTQTRALLRTGSQVASLLVAARPDLFKKSGYVAQTVAAIREVLIGLLMSGATKGEKRGSLEKREMSKFEEGTGESGGAESWAVSYHLIILLEKLYTHLPAATDYAATHPNASVDDDVTSAAAADSVVTKSGKSTPKRGSKTDVVSTPKTAANISTTSAGNSDIALLLSAVQEAMVFPHAWVRASACRVLRLYLSRRDVSSARLRTSPDGHEILTMPNGLYQLGRRLCVVLNQPKITDSLLDAAVASLVFTVRAMIRNPNLAQVTVEKSAVINAVVEKEKKVTGDSSQPVKKTKKPLLPVSRDDDQEDDDDDEEDEEEDNDKEEEEEEDDDENEVGEGNHPPTSGETVTVNAADWVMQRLKGLGADSRGRRRYHVIKVFSALVVAEEVDFVRQHLQQIVEVGVRVRMAGGAAGADMLPGATLPSAGDEASSKESKEAANELLEALERKLGAATFIGAYAEAQRRLQATKARKKKELAAEAVTDPRQYAKRKLEETQRKKESRKRKSLKHAAVKGLKKKQRGPSAILYEEE